MAKVVTRSKSGSPDDTIRPTWLYSYDQASQLIGLPRNTIRNMVMDGRLPSIPITQRGIKRIRGRDLLTFIEEGVS